MFISLKPYNPVSESWTITATKQVMIAMVYNELADETHDFHISMSTDNTDDPAKFVRLAGLELNKGSPNLIIMVPGKYKIVGTFKNKEDLRRNWIDWIVSPDA